MKLTAEENDSAKAEGGAETCHWICPAPAWPRSHMAKCRFAGQAHRTQSSSWGFAGWGLLLFEEVFAPWPPWLSAWPWLWPWTSQLEPRCHHHSSGRLLLEGSGAQQMSMESTWPRFPQAVARAALCGRITIVNQELSNAGLVCAPRHFAWQAWHLVTSTFVLRGRRGTCRHPPSFCVAGVALMAKIACDRWWGIVPESSIHCRWLPIGRLFAASYGRNMW